MHNHKWQLYVDGAARHNPGPAGAGFYLEKDGEAFEQGGMYLGIKTNNQAEYMSLLLGLHFARPHIKAPEKLIIKADSELLVRQLTGRYRVHNPALKKLFLHVQKYLLDLNYEVHHIPREQNAIADKWANSGIDRKTAVPSDFQHLVV